MQGKTIYVIARQELTINIRNRWTLIFALVFGVLVVSIAYVGIMAEGFSGVQSFTRTSASLLNLVLYVIPLVGIVMGTVSFTGDKGSMELLFAQPLVRTEVMLGKVLGVFASIALSTIIGFTLAGLVVVLGNGPEGIASYLSFVVLALVLSLAFLNLAVLVATACRRKAKAFGIALFLWFFFVLFYDLMVLGSTLLLKGQTANRALFLSLFGNPVDMVRVATLIILDNVTIFGASGAALLRFLGGGTLSVLALIGGLCLWTILPLVVSHRLLLKQDI